MNTPKLSTARIFPAAFRQPFFQYTQSGFKEEHGFVMIFFAMLIAIIIGIGGMVIDHSREEVTVQDLQRTADAAAMAAARRLNGQVSGWRDAKKAAIVTLRNNPVQGSDPAWFQSLRLDGLPDNGGRPPFWDEDRNVRNVPRAERSRAPLSNPGISGASGEVGVTVERGIYRANGRGSYTFTSLEGDRDGERSYTALYLIANAVRVRVNLGRLDTFFGKIYGQSEFTDLNRESIAVMDNQLKVEALPMAIPLCQLMLNTDPVRARGDRVDTSFKPEKHCDRELYFTESNAKGELLMDLSGSGAAEPSFLPVSREDRDAGWLRNDIYNRLPHTRNTTGQPDACQIGNSTSAFSNCLKVPIYGTLGTFQSAPPEPTQTADAARVVQALRDKIDVGVGEYFVHLNNPRDLVNDSTLRRQIADVINQSGKTFRSAFMLNGRPRLDYPFLPTSFRSPDPQGRMPVNGPDREKYDLLYRVPSSAGGASNPIRFLKPDMANGSNLGQLNYTSPMCHDDQIPVNDLDNGKVLEGVVPLVAAHIEEYNGDPVKFCDYRSVFSGSAQAALAPIPEAQPEVVGFAKVKIFSFNFVNFDADSRFAPRALDRSIFHGTQTATPRFSGVEDGMPAYVDAQGTPELQALTGEILNFEAFFSDFVECQRNLNPSHPRYLTRMSRCIRRLIRRNAVPQRPAWEALSNCFQLNRIEDKLEELSDYMSEISGNPAAAAGLIQPVNAALDFLKTALEYPLPAWPDTHCLYQLRYGYFDKNNPASYEPLRPIRAGLGCGGLRARISCDTVDPATGSSSTNPVSLITTKPWQENRVSLVKEGAAL